MQSVIIGSGWHVPLFSIEVSTLLNLPEDIFQGLGTRFIQLETPNFLLDSLSTAATVDDIYSPGKSISFSQDESMKDLRSKFANWLSKTQLDKTGQTVAVRAIRIGAKKEGWSSSQLAGIFGGVLADNSWEINLSNPSIEIGLVIDTVNSKIAWGVKHFQKTPRQGWAKRTPTQRPFFKPISMDPRHAILMANLVKGQGTIIDPMAGTGGFLVEASFAGLSAIGVDVDEEMVRGAKLNLDWARELGATGKVSVIEGNSTCLSAILPKEYEPYSGIVFDPPYGRNSQGTEAPVALFQKILTSSREVVTKNSNLACLLPCDPNDSNIVHGMAWQDIEEVFSASDWKVLGKWVLPVHASLGRLLVLAKAV
nr:hypothetical protein [Euryarchaeota archaeon]